MRETKDDSQIQARSEVGGSLGRNEGRCKLLRRQAAVSIVHQASRGIKRRISPITRQLARTCD
jgi:hypothetical protein